VATCERKPALPNALMGGVVWLCCLTFELSGERRDSAWPARRMMTVSASRAKCYAGASPLERRVRPHSLRAKRPRRAPQPPAETTK